MGYAASTPVSPYHPGMELMDCCTTARFVTAAIRLWTRRALASGHDDPVWPDWQRGMELAGLEARACAAFDATMRTYGVCALNTLSVRPMPCPRLGGGEALVLTGLYLAQHGDASDLHLHLIGALSPAGVRLIVAPLETLADALCAVGMTLGLPRHAPVGAPSVRQRGSDLLH